MLLKYLASFQPNQILAGPNPPLNLNLNFTCLFVPVWVKVSILWLNLCYCDVSVLQSPAALLYNIPDLRSNGLVW